MQVSGTALVRHCADGQIPTTCGVTIDRVVLEFWRYQLAVDVFRRQDPLRRPNFLAAQQVTGIDRRVLKRGWLHGWPALQTGRPPMPAIKDMMDVAPLPEESERSSGGPDEAEDSHPAAEPEAPTHGAASTAGTAPFVEDVTSGALLAPVEKAEGHAPGEGGQEGQVHAPGPSLLPAPVVAALPVAALPVAVGAAPSAPEPPPAPAPPAVVAAPTVPTPPASRAPSLSALVAADSEAAKLERVRIAMVDALVEEEKLTRAARDALTGVAVIAGNAAKAVYPVILKLQKDAELERDPDRALKILKQISAVLNQTSVAAMRVQSMTRVLAGLPASVTAVEHRTVPERALSPEEISARTAAVFEGLRRATAIDVDVLPNDEESDAA